MTEQELGQAVSRRRVFYIPGYDPHPPRRYRELYRNESELQGAISGYEVAIAPKSGGESYGWRASGRFGPQVVNAEIDVLVWSDIVRDSMSTSIPQTYLQLIKTAWIYISTGTLRRLMWMRKGPVIAALYPVGVLLLQLIAALVVAGILSGALVGAGRFVAGWAETGLPSWGVSEGLTAILTSGWLWLVWALGWVVFLGGVWAILRWFKSRDGKIYAHYLMHDFAFSARWWGAYPPMLEERLAEFRAQIAEALAQDDVDEVLVVGHSSGAHLGISILSDLLQETPPAPDGPKLAFLTLGHVVPMVSFLPKAYRLRADLAFLSSREDITWLDVSAPGDGCSFALCDPVAVTGLVPTGKRWPLVISAAFTQSLRPETWAKLRWRFFRLHFQYLCAFDKPLDYDYFLITAGPLTLGQRYAERKPAKSRIDVPASKFTTLSPAQ